MIKLLVFDIDGTVLPYGERGIPREVLDALRALADNGVKLAVSSGRSYASLRALLAPLDKNLPCICHDGALSYANGKIVYRRPLTADAVRAFWNAPSNRTRTLVFYGENTVYLRKGSSDEAARADLCETPLPVDSFYALREPVYKAAAYGAGTLRDIEIPAEMRRTYRTDTAEEYVCAYTNKGTALSDMQLRLGVSVYDTAAAGDGAGDIPMFRRTAVSCAPPEAPEAVRESATEVGSVSAFLRALVKTTQKPHRIL